MFCSDSEGDVNGTMRNMESVGTKLREERALETYCNLVAIDSWYNVFCYT